MKGIAKKTSPPRVNIYLPDQDLRRHIKTAAAKKDLSVSEYCLRAITAQLIRDNERPSVRNHRNRLGMAVEAARRFQAQTFAERVFTVSSADLIRNAREHLTSR
jgi:hypothetical protein